MLSKKVIVLLLASFLVKMSLAQFCPQLGARPAGAYPVCGNGTIVNTMPIFYYCFNHEVYVPGCTGNIVNGVQLHLIDYNPYWYSFTCYQSGSLGFLVTPFNLNDDYDWQLFDITGHSPDVVYNINLTTIPIRGNWVGTYGVTGASSTGAGGLFQCPSNPLDNRPSISSMPTLIAGHKYLLLISHAVGTSGYSISFGGGTADIGDPLLPKMISTNTNCSGTPLSVKFNKKLKCSTMHLGGSDFSISPPLATVIAARRIDCDNSFGADSAILTLSNPLPPGNYSVVIQTGIDGNTVSDFCNQFLAVGESFPFEVGNVPPAVMSVNPPACAADEIEVLFSKPVYCKTIWPDPSEFVITGTTPVTVIHVQGGNCTTGEYGVATMIRLKLSAPLLGQGNYQVTLVPGGDGNTLFDECDQEIPAGTTANFSTKEAVNADFTYNIRYGCKADTIDYFHDGKNGVITWKWDFNELQKKSSLQNPSIFYKSFGQKHTQLTVSNGVCSDIKDIPILLDNGVKAVFEVTALICPNEPAIFKNNSIGNITKWTWNFGNGTISNSAFPSPQFYIPPRVTTDVFPTLTIENNYGCIDSAMQKIVVPNSCYIAVPNAFTPNNDGLNDYLYPLTAYKATDLLFRVYNRVGQLVFQTRDWTNKWDGTFKGQNADPGAYIWILQYTNSESGKRIEQKGTSILLR